MRSLRFYGPGDLRVEEVPQPEPEPGEVLDVHLKQGCGQVVRLDRDRYQRRNQVKLSLLDLPFLPDELRELATPGDVSSAPRG